jgi:hypothetical protein
MSNFSSPVVKVEVTGARGASAADVARRSGAYGVLPTDSDAVVLQKLAQYLLDANPNFEGPQGSPGGNVESVGLAEALTEATVIPGATTSFYTSGTSRGRWVEDATLTGADVSAHPLAIKKLAGRYFRRDPRDLWIEQFGAKSIPMGKSFDSQPAVNAAIKYSGFCANRNGNLAGTANGPKVRAGMGWFYLGSRTSWKNALLFEGAGRGHILGGNATIFACEESGFILEREDTLNFQTAAALLASK